MKICACSSEVCTHWPSPETSRSNSAVRIPIAQNNPAVRSATGMPTRIDPRPRALNAGKPNPSLTPRVKRAKAYRVVPMKPGIDADGTAETEG